MKGKINMINQNESNMFEDNYFNNIKNWYGKKVDYHDISLSRPQILKLNYCFKIFPDIKNGFNKFAFVAGTGLGGEAEFLRNWCYTVDGCDISKYAIRIIKDSHFFVHDLEEPFKTKKKYDLIVAEEVLEHLKNPKKAIQNLYSILKDGGTLLATTPNKISPYYPFNRYFDKTHISIKSKKEWMGIFKSLRWNSIDIKTVQFIPFIWKIIKFDYIGNSLIINAIKFSRGN